MSPKLSVQKNASFCHFDNFLKCQTNGLDQTQIQVIHYKAQEHFMCLYLLLKRLRLPQSRISAVNTLILAFYLTVP